VGVREALNVMDLWEVVFDKFSRKIPSPKGGPKSAGIGAKALTIEIEREVPLLIYEEFRPRFRFLRMAPPTQ
jgi:hypothetical protein